jgi:hypothetical protein
MATRQKASFMPLEEKLAESRRATRFADGRTKAAHHMCPIMHVMCVKAVTSGNRGMKIANHPGRRIVHLTLAFHTLSSCRLKS